MQLPQHDVCATQSSVTASHCALDTRIYQSCQVSHKNVLTLAAVWAVGDPQQLAGTTVFLRNPSDDLDALLTEIQPV